MSSSASVKHLVIHVVHMTDTPAPQSRQQLRVTMQLQLSATDMSSAATALPVNLSAAPLRARTHETPRTCPPARPPACDVAARLA